LDYLSSRDLPVLFSLLIPFADAVLSSQQFPDTIEDRIHRYPFGIALADVRPNRDELLQLELGMIVEDIVFQPNDLCEGRVRSKAKKFVINLKFFGNSC
jgi:hypothetical protein